MGQGAVLFVYLHSQEGGVGGPGREGKFRKLKKVRTEERPFREKITENGEIREDALKKEKT